MTYPPNEPDLSAVCPHLGLADDADSHATYATEAHRCYKMPNPTRIAGGHQETYCLLAAHTTCPIYTGEGISRVAAPAAAAGAVAAQRPEAPPAATQTAPQPARPSARTETPAPAPRPKRQAPDGQMRPQPRAGGISMPAATIGLFALAIVLIAVAFLINQAVDDDENGGTNEADAFATQNAAAQLTAQAGTQTPEGEETPGGEETPDGEETPGEGTPGTTPTGTAGEGDEYTVVAGDTCGDIAEDHGVTLAELLEANDMTEEDCVNLQPGDTLTIP